MGHKKYKYPVQHYQTRRAARISATKYKKRKLASKQRYVKASVEWGMPKTTAEQHWKTAWNWTYKRQPVLNRVQNDYNRNNWTDKLPDEYEAIQRHRNEQEATDARIAYWKKRKQEWN